MAWTLCTSGSVIGEAGMNVNEIVKASGSLLAGFSNQVEMNICAETKYDWIANYASVGINFKGALTDISACLIANKMIKSNMAGFTSRSESQTMLDVNRDTARIGISWLKDKNNQAKMV